MKREVSDMRYTTEEKDAIIKKGVEEGKFIDPNPTTHHIKDPNDLEAGTMCGEPGPTLRWAERYRITCEDCKALDVERLRLLDEKWAREAREFDEKYAPMLVEIRAIMERYGLEGHDDFSLGLDHLGESCPPN